MKDLIIIGSGPAGLSAAIYAVRAMMDVVVLEKQMFSGGQVINTESVDNYLGMHGMSGFALAKKFREHADALQVPFIIGEVVSIEETDGHPRVHLQSGEVLEAKNLLIATGAKHRMLNVPGEERLQGMGVSYCATCDGAFFRDKTVAVVGGGDVALEDALYLSRMCEKVYLIHRREGLRGAKVLQKQVFETDNIEFLPAHEVIEIAGESGVEKICVVEKTQNETREIAVSGVFIAVGMIPETGFVKDIVKTDDMGYIVAGEDGRTSAESIFAAGDVRTKALRQIVTAAADGAAAVASMGD